MKPYEQRFPWNLDWNLLRTFMVVVEQRGISRAADFLGLKQPTISAALKRLEDTTGHALIIRKPNEFSVTRAGSILYQECSQIFGSVSQLPSLLESGAEELRGHIAIATTSHVISDHYDDLMHHFASTHPKVTFSTTVAESEAVVSRVQQNRASLGLCLLHKIPADLKASILYREYFGLFCGPRHALFTQERITLAEIEGETSVSFQTETEEGPLYPVAQLRARAKLAPGWRGVSSSLHELRRMIVAGVGIGALPLHAAKRDIESGLLRQLPPYDGLPLVNIYLLTNPLRKLSDAETVFLSTCQAAIKDNPLEARTYS